MKIDSKRRRLFVGWRDSDTGRLTPIGLLVQESDGQRTRHLFSYLKRAEEVPGFKPFPSFPSLYRLYRSNALFPLFSNRVMPRERPDFGAYVERLELDADADPFTILTKSGGVKPNDWVEVFPEPEQDQTGHLRCTFFADVPSGSRALVATLRSNDSLQLTDFGPAVRLNVTRTSEVAGLVPDYLAGFLRDMRELCEEEPRVAVEHVSGPHGALRHRLLCRVETCAPEGYAPFSEPQFQPLASSASLTSVVLYPEDWLHGDEEAVARRLEGRMGMDRDQAIKRFGERAEFGPCIVGRDIDLLAVRGFAPLDALAAVSAPDVFDDEVNPTGTQRDLKTDHADASFRYATRPSEGRGTNVRAFPEIILNVRDMLVVEVSDWVTGETLDFDSHSVGSDIPTGPVRLSVDLEAIEFPKSTIDPEVSRVDGNHRLYGPDAHLESLDTGEGNRSDSITMPEVPFMIFLNLTLDEELKLFNDLNGQHMGMEPSLIVTQTVRLGPEDAKLDPKRLPAWIAFELTRPGHAFEGIVFVGGSRRGAREAGRKLRLTLSALRGAVALMIRQSHDLRETLRGQPEAILAVIDNYWTAIGETFPEAWSNKRDFILLQSIGLNGFAEYGASVIDRAEGNVSVDYFRQVLEGIKSEITLDRKAEIFVGRAGAGGATFVAQILRDASTAESLVRSKILGALADEDHPGPIDAAASALEGSVDEAGR